MYRMNRLDFPGMIPRVPYRSLEHGVRLRVVATLLVTIHLLSGIVGPLHRLLHAHELEERSRTVSHSLCSEVSCHDPIHVSTIGTDSPTDEACGLCSLCVRPQPGYLLSSVPSTAYVSSRVTAVGGRTDKGFAEEPILLSTLPRPPPCLI